MGLLNNLKRRLFFFLNKYKVGRIIVMISVKKIIPEVFIIIYFLAAINKSN